MNNTGLNFCRKCGGSLTGRTKFCGHCGARIAPVAGPTLLPAKSLRDHRTMAALGIGVLLGALLIWHTPPHFGSDPARADKSTFARVIGAHLAQHCFFIQPYSLTQFPASIVTEGRAFTPSLRQYEALTKVGLLASVDGQVTPPFRLIGAPPTVSGRTYSLTDLGKQALQNPSSTAFCAGHYAVDEVLGFTIPGPARNGVTATEVTYSFSPHDIPGWATNAEVQAAFPGLATALVPKQTTQVDLVLTSNGWVTAE
jgi:hypothetical protein